MTMPEKRLRPRSSSRQDVCKRQQRRELRALDGKGLEPRLGAGAHRPIVGGRDRSSRRVTVVAPRTMQPTLQGERSAHEKSARARISSPSLDRLYLRAGRGRQTPPAIGPTPGGQLARPDRPRTRLQATRLQGSLGHWLRDPTRCFPADPSTALVHGRCQSLGKRHTPAGVGQFHRPQRSAERTREVWLRLAGSACEGPAHMPR